MCETTTPAFTGMFDTIRSSVLRFKPMRSVRLDVGPINQILPISSVSRNSWHLMDHIVGLEWGIRSAPNGGELADELGRLLVDDHLRARESANGPCRASALCGAGQFTSSLQQSLRFLEPRAHEL
jgi:hypothetical protein